MANPQPNIFIPISKEWHKAIRKIRISGVQWQVLNTIIFKTWGAFPRAKKAQISQEEFMEETGLKSVAISKAKNDLLLMNLITKFGNGNNVSYSIQKDYELWNPLPKKVIASNSKGSQRPKKKPLPNLVTADTKFGNESNLHLIHIKNKETAQSLYDFYKNSISPQRKSATRAKENILYYLKKYSFEDLKKSISNYASTLNGSAPQFRKDPANFFGKNDRYFIDFLPDNFEPSKEETGEPRSKECNAETMGEFFENP